MKIALAFYTNEKMENTELSTPIKRGEIFFFSDINFFKFKKKYVIIQGMEGETRWDFLEN